MKSSTGTFYMHLDLNIIGLTAIINYTLYLFSCLNYYFLIMAFPQIVNILCHFHIFFYMALILMTTKV